MSAPKLFFSYSWSNPAHEQWVISLATDLRENGVDVKLDKWDLKPGHDTFSFMEEMVTDPEVNKVIMICDEKYATKANVRKGGVGTETQIISKEVYEKQDQEKFVAVVRENDGEGKPCVPVYYKSRMHIDFTEDDKYAESFDKLLRWIFNKPEYVKPELGQMPSFLSEGEHISLGTTSIYKRCIDAIKNHKAHAEGSLEEYCSIFVKNLERFRITASGNELMMK